MTIPDLSVPAAITAMAVVTIGCRIGGYVLFSRITPTPFLRRLLAHIPGCIFCAFVVPTLIAGPARNWPAAAATILAMTLTRNLGVAIGAGVSVAWGLKLLAS